MIKNLFFDLDGTLTDPKAGIEACIRHSLAEMGVEDIWDDLSWCIGPPLHDSLGQMVGDARTDEAVAIYRERFARIGLYENEVYGGIETCLSDLKDAGFILYLATSKVRFFASRILEHFGLATYFTDVFGAELNGLRSNKADLLSHALDLSGAQEMESMMIGDRKHDVVGAKANGLSAIGVEWGYGSVAELEDAGVDYRVATRPDLADLLLSLRDK